jgi:hypothetical protein
LRLTQTGREINANISRNCRLQRQSNAGQSGLLSLGQRNSSFNALYTGFTVIKVNEHVFIGHKFSPLKIVAVLLRDETLVEYDLGQLFWQNAHPKGWA